ncbi:MAG TPA: S-layer protein, partial [Planctomycetaceae bacterium]|nr:S-layer protein [Planctomycetaceae bacterium]
HKGGVRFETDSPEYRILSEWIAQGATAPEKVDPVIERLEVLPSRSILTKGQTQHILVQAHYSDQSVRDVTRWTSFSSVNESVASVDAAGTIQVTGYGEGAIVCNYSSKIAISKITSPYPQEIAPETYAKSPRNNFIDELVIKQLKRLNLPPSPQSNDADFIRRAYVDTIGTLPTPEEVQAFVTDQSQDKRNQLINRLLDRPDFIDYWTYKWSDLLLVNGALIRPEPVKAYHGWIREHVKQNTPWDKMVRELITSQGSSIENGATNFYAIHQDPESMTENVSQAFLGLSIGCAKCHNHPLEKWTNNQYYAMANFFSRVRAKGWGGAQSAGDGIRTLFVATEGDLVQPLTGKPQPPTPLDGTPIDIDSPEDRRVYLAEWLTSKDNDFFSRAITNRVWANYFGVGLVEAVDDMRESNPASNEELLAAASDYLVDHDFDLKALMKIILQSAAYQRSSQPLPENKDEKRFYSRYYPRRMMAEVLLDAISQVT